MSEWISIKDRLPKNFEMVCLLVNGRESIAGFMVYDENENIHEDAFEPTCYEFSLIDFESERIELNPIGPGRVSHWQPLPAPPMD